MGAIKLDGLEPAELIGIFDALFACLVSWLEGNSMDQVLFTCLYLHAPSQIQDKALRVFCTAVRNLIVVIKNIIILAAVNEEEDFQLYGNSALLAAEKAQPSTIAGLLKDVEDELVRKCKQLPANEDLSLMAVVHRLRFMRHLFQAIYQVELMAGVESAEEAVNEIYKSLNVASELLPLIKRTIERGTQPVEGCKCFCWQKPNYRLHTKPFPLLQQRHLIPWASLRAYMIVVSHPLFRAALRYASDPPAINFWKRWSRVLNMLAK